jgi:hypothetical protein
VFAGRRSTDKLYLALQNAYCAQALDGYAGTSSVYALEILDGVLGRQGISEQQRQQMLGDDPHDLPIIFKFLTCLHADRRVAGAQE